MICAQPLQSHESGGAIKPAGKMDLLAQRTSFASEPFENGLNHFLGNVRISDLAKRRRKNEIDMPLYKDGESLIRHFRSVAAQGIVFVELDHLST